MDIGILEGSGAITQEYLDDAERMKINKLQLKLKREKNTKIFDRLVEESIKKTINIQ